MYCKLLYIALLLLIISSCSREDKPKQPPKNQLEKMSEYLGYLAVEKFKSGHLQFPLDVDSYIQGVEEARQGKEANLSREDYRRMMKEYQKKVIEAESQKNLAEAENYLQSLDKSKDIVITSDGKVLYRVLIEGNAESDDAISEESLPILKIEGRYLDNKVFHKSGEDFRRTELSTLPKGLVQGLIGMKAGEKRQIIIHPDLGYGLSGFGKPNALLIYEVEVRRPNTKKVDKTK